MVEEEKVDVNLRHPLGWTPLLVAVINDKFDCVKYLLSKGADPNQSDEFTNVHSMAKKLHMNPVHGNKSNTYENEKLLNNFFMKIFQFMHNVKETFVIVFLLVQHSMVLQHFTMLC